MNHHINSKESESESVRARGGREQGLKKNKQNHTDIISDPPSLNLWLDEGPSLEP